MIRHLSQREAILEDLRAGVALTPRDALQRHGCFRLAARVAELKKAGWEIETRLERVGEARVACYRLATPVQESWL